MNLRTDETLSSPSLKRGELARKLLKASTHGKRSRLPTSPILSDADQSVTSRAAKVYGPYCDASQWRLVVLDGDVRKSLVYESEAEALAVRASLLANLDACAGRKIGDVVNEFLTHKRDMGLVERTVCNYRNRLLSFLPADEPSSSITAKRAETLYREHTKTVAAATHHKSLRTAKALFAYCMSRKYAAFNPFADIRVIGKAKTGKPQLRQDEAKRLSNLLIAEAEKGDIKALALLVQILLGLRSAEVLNLRKRDFDCEGTVVWVDGTKNRNAKRRLALESATARTLLSRRVATLTADAFVFAASEGDRPPTTTVLHSALARFCKQAAVPAVCPHSLRGLHSSLAVQAGVTSAAVAQALGHATDAVTRRHYIAPSALDSARAQRVAAALLDARDLDNLKATLQALPTIQLDRLCASLGYHRFLPAS